MAKTSLVRKAVAWAACALLACSVAPAVAFAGGGGEELAAQGLSAARQPAQTTPAMKHDAKRALKDYTWAQLKKISDKIAAAKSNSAGLAVAKRYGLVNAKGKLTGATKALKLTDGTKTSVRILGFRHDRLASGGLSGISFEFADAPVKHQVNKTDSNEGGWKKSGIRSWLNSSFYKKLPSSLRKCIAPAKKQTNNKGRVDNPNDTSAVSVTSDKIWLSSSAEVYGKITEGKVYNAEGKQYKLYSDKKVTMENCGFCEKKWAGFPCFWWLRSPYVGNSCSFHYVIYGGRWGYGGADAGTTCVSPSFCF